MEHQYYSLLLADKKTDESTIDKKAGESAFNLFKHRGMAFAFLFFISLGISLTANGAQAATLKVPEDYPIIQAAVDNAVSGDTILVGPGTYYENINIAWKKIDLKGAGPHFTVIDANNGPYAIQAGGAPETSIEGFTIKNANIGLRLDHAWGIKVYNNIIENNNAGIVLYYSSWGDSSQPIIKNNIIVYNRGVAIYNTGSWLKIFNNVISYNSLGFGTDPGGDVAQSFLSNNIVSENLWGVYRLAEAQVNLSYNDVWNNQFGNYLSNISPGQTDISFDPLFVDPGTRNFHLQENSPLINAGDPSILDPDGTISDIGAFGGPDAPLPTLTETVFRVDNLLGLVNGFSSNPTFKNENMQKAFVNKLLEVKIKIQNSEIEDAINKLSHDLLQKTDGGLEPNANLKDDWFEEEPLKKRVYLLIKDLIRSLEHLQD